MSVFYRARLKVSAPTLKQRFVDGIFVARDVAEDLTAMRACVAERAKAQLEAAGCKDATVEVVLFRRSEIGFILSGNIRDLDV